MATAQMRVPTGITTPSSRRNSAAARFLGAERTEEIYPILLEEIVAAGYSRALVAKVDLETSEIVPFVSLNWPKAQVQKFRISMYATENPIVRGLHSLRPEVTPGNGRSNAQLYIHPLMFRNPGICWEAKRDQRSECLAVDNEKGARRLHFQEQTCGTCTMHGYAAAVIVEVRGKQASLVRSEVGALAELANRYLTRLHKIEHYYHRMTDMETTIGQMQTVLESMADPVILTDTHHRVIMQNKAAERFFKLPENVSEGRVRAVELNNLLFSAALSSMFVAGGESSRDMTLVDAIEGEEVLFEAVSAPSYSPDGRRTGMVTVMRDVTDLRRADEELRGNYEKLRSAEEVVRQDRDRLNLIIENVGDPIVVCDREAKVVLLDPLAQELFGTDRTTRNPYRIRNQAKLDAYIASFTYSFSDRESQPLRLVDPATKEEVEYDAHSGKIYDQRGQVAYTVSVLRDLTALRRIEQLRVERRMVEMEKFAAAGRLAGTIAHEVNNPLEAIKNCIFLLQDSVNADAAPIYGILKTETERVARIVRQMLGLYRNTEQVGNVDVNSVMEDTLLLFARQLNRAGVTVERELGDLPPMVGSADQLRQVLSNLVVNAKDSMLQGGKLLIRTRVLHSTGVRQWIRILIADTGCGISKNVASSMFEPFVTTKGERGTGLGLWIVKGIIENHGGRLRVRSKLNTGTVFSIELPVVR
jgi:signal transduction histidine kinase